MQVFFQILPIFRQFLAKSGYISAIQLFRLYLAIFQLYSAILNSYSEYLRLQ